MNKLSSDVLFVSQIRTVTIRISFISLCVLLGVTVVSVCVLARHRRDVVHVVGIVTIASRFRHNMTDTGD